jgi:hypothetical protein
MLQIPLRLIIDRWEIDLINLREGLFDMILFLKLIRLCRLWPIATSGIAFIGPSRKEIRCELTIEWGLMLRIAEFVSFGSLLFEKYTLELLDTIGERKGLLQVDGV